jgi:hypothetical protein
MTFLDSLLGSGQQRQEFQDFTQGYDQGDASGSGAIPRLSRCGPAVSPRRLVGGSAWQPPSRIRCISH